MNPISLLESYRPLKIHMPFWMTFCKTWGGSTISVKCKQMCSESSLLSCGLFVSYLWIRANVEVLYSQQGYLLNHYLIRDFPSVTCQTFSVNTWGKVFKVDILYSFRNCTARRWQCSVIWRAGANWTGQAWVTCRSDFPLSERSWETCPTVCLTAGPPWITHRGYYPH